MAGTGPHRSLQPLEPQMIGDNFMSWASKEKDKKYQRYFKFAGLERGDPWGVFFCFLNLAAGLFLTVFSYRAFAEGAIGNMILPMSFALLFYGCVFYLSWCTRIVMVDASFGYTPLMQAKEKYNQAVRCFNKVKNYPAEIDRYEDLATFRQMLLHLDWRAATGDLNQKVITHFEEMVAAFEARYYPKPLDGPEAAELLSEIKP